MKKLLLASITALLLATGTAHAQGIYMGRDGRVHAQMPAPAVHLLLEPART